MFYININGVFSLLKNHGDIWVKESVLNEQLFEALIQRIKSYKLIFCEEIKKYNIVKIINETDLQEILIMLTFYLTGVIAVFVFNFYHYNSPHVKDKIKKNTNKLIEDVINFDFWFTPFLSWFYFLLILISLIIISEVKDD